MNSKEVMLGEKEWSYQKGCQTEGQKFCIPLQMI